MTCSIIILKLWELSESIIVGQLEERMREMFSVSRELECRLWHRESLYTAFSYKLLTGDSSWIVQDAGLEEKEVYSRNYIACKHARRVDCNS